MRYFIANWKMNMSTKSAKVFIQAFNKKYKTVRRGNRVVICPSFIALPIISKKVRGTKKLSLGSQDVFWQKKGNYTGEVSPENLKKLGVEYTIVGHSERRKIANETDEMVNKKLLSLMQIGITPILCVGETKSERSKKLTKKIITRELSKGLKSIPRAKELIVAYEPIWAISKKGKGSSMDPDVIKAEIFYIRATLKRLRVNQKVKRVSVLYGGSVSVDTISDIMKIPGVDGVLVGNASLSPDSFSKIALC